MEDDDMGITELFPNFSKEQQVGQKYQRNFIECHNQKCKNQVKIPYHTSQTSPTNIFCQKCIDKYYLRNTFKKIHFLEDSITEKQTHIQDLQKKITNIQNEVKDLKEELFLEKIHIKYDVDVVSENEKFYQGSDGSARDGEYNIELETHCTIVRVEESPENVYFGHVTLVIRYLSGLEFRWHYGTYVSPNTIPNRRNLVHDFWSKNDEHTRFPPSSTKVKRFGYFEKIPLQTTLANMMKHHLDKCAEYFMRQKQKQRWPSQVWYEYDQVEVGGKRERATDLVERLQEIKGNRASNPYENLESLRIKRLEEEAARRVLAIQAKQTKLANQAKPNPPKKEKQTLEPEELERIKAQQAEARKQQSVRDTREQVRNQQLQERFNIEEQERMSAAERIRINKITRARKQRQKIANQGTVEEQDKFNQDIQEHLEKADEERAKLKPVQKEEAKKNRIERLAISDANKLLELVEKNKDSWIKMEERIKQLETVDHISKDVFDLRLKLADTYSKLFKRINSFMTDVESNKLINDENKTPILESLRPQKEYLHGLLNVLLNKDQNYLIDFWRDTYIKEHLPKEEKLKTLNPQETRERDASRIRRELIKYYRLFKVMCDDHIKSIPPFLTKEESDIIRRKTFDLRFKIVKPDKRFDDLCQIEGDILREFYKTQKDNLNEDDAYIAENMTILYPKRFSTLDKAKFFLDKLDSFKKAKAAKKLSTKNVILLSEIFEEESSS
jgi:hypothetical protein